VVITLDNCTDSVIVYPCGHLDLGASFDLRHAIGEVLGAELNVVIDLRHLGSVDAEGLSALVGSVRRIRAIGGTVNVTNANRRVQWLLGLIGVDRLVGASSDLCYIGAA
jgi:anti-sigma B factor antagonist